MKFVLDYIPIFGGIIRPGMEEFYVGVADDLVSTALLF